MNALDLVVLALATARLSRLVTTDTFPPIRTARDAILHRWPNADTTFSDIQETGKDTLGYRIGVAGKTPVFQVDGQWYASEPRAWSEVVSCVWCASIWLGIAVWALAWFYPVTVVLLVPLALSQVAGWMND